MTELIFNTARNIGLGIFVNGAFALQFGEAMTKGYWAVAEGIIIMFLAGFMELRSKK
ncbi:hypothetical protein ACHJH3_08550 [Campylobacter sp. MOP7]|uniref:hypothetical protein n=1 Tax=Campylobacter canis TaxID=3378588 RepID=UPI00387E8A21